MTTILIVIFLPLVLALLAVYMVLQVTCRCR